MKIIKTEIPEVLIIELDIFKDDRGFFVEKYNQRVEQQFKQRDQHTLERVGVTQWDFEALPEEILLKLLELQPRKKPSWKRHPSSG